jgi:hypothetical protein
VQQQPTMPQPSGDLLRLARPADRTVTGASPDTRRSFTIRQLAAQGSIRFTWNGNASEYQFALYRHDGVAIVSRTTITATSYTFNDIGKLQEGTYVWQVYEKNRRDEWELPSIAYVFYVLSQEN